MAPRWQAARSGRGREDARLECAAADAGRGLLCVLGRDGGHDAALLPRASARRVEVAPGGVPDQAGLRAREESLPESVDRLSPGISRIRGHLFGPGLER